MNTYGVCSNRELKKEKSLIPEDNLNFHTNCEDKRLTETTK